MSSASAFEVVACDNVCVYHFVWCAIMIGILFIILGFCLDDVMGLYIGVLFNGLCLD